MKIMEVINRYLTNSDIDTNTKSVFLSVETPQHFKEKLDEELRKERIIQKQKFDLLKELDQLKRDIHTKAKKYNRNPSQLTESIKNELANNLLDIEDQQENLNLEIRLSRERQNGYYTMIKMVIQLLNEFKFKEEEIIELQEVKDDTVSMFEGILNTLSIDLNPTQLKKDEKLEKAKEILFNVPTTSFENEE